MELVATKKRACASGGGSLVADDPDRLSALPEAILHTIMSFMKARQVVQTCVLSKHWRDLWRSVPSLDIDLDKFKTGARNTHIPYNDRDWENFEDFAINLMNYCTVALLDSFRLNVPTSKAPHHGPELAASWLRRAMKYYTPDRGIQEGSSSNSWCLKKLYLGYILLDDRFVKHVSSLCHSLEDLELENCVCRFNDITSHSLKNLVLKECCCIGFSYIMSPTLKSIVIDGGLNSAPRLVITAPAPAYLHLVRVGDFYGGISINNMTSLHKASIHLRGYRARVRESNPGQDQFMLLCNVSNVTHLELSDLRTMVLSKVFITFGQFKNLRSLLLENCDLSDDFHTLVLFLQNSPHLEKLTLRHWKFSNGSRRKKGAPKPKKASSSQWRSSSVWCVNLKLTEIIYKDDDVHKLVEFLLHISEYMPQYQLKLRKVD